MLQFREQGNCRHTIKMLFDCAESADSGNSISAKICTICLKRFYPIFTDVSSNNRCVVARYHSLSGYDLPATVNVIGDVNGIPMAAEFSACQALGFQFHPESLLTPKGKQLLANSMTYLLSQQV